MTLKLCSNTSEVERPVLDTQMTSIMDTGIIDVPYSVQHYFFGFFFVVVNANQCSVL